MVLMNVRSISLLAILLLLLNGCGEKTPVNKTGESLDFSASSVPAVMVKELTPEEKFAELKRKAEAGDAQAQDDLGYMYDRGEGVALNKAKAVEWYTKAAEQDDA